MVVRSTIAVLAPWVLWFGCHTIAGLDDLEVGVEKRAQSASNGVSGGGAGGMPTTSAGGTVDNVSAPSASGVGGTGGVASTTDCCVEHQTPGCTSPTTSASGSSSSGMGCPYCVCMTLMNGYCCSTGWAQQCVNVATTNCAGPCGC